MRSVSAAIVCAGAVIGAGFASGREIFAFFSKYGAHGWWLIAIAALMMTALCSLCFRAAVRSQASCWSDLFLSQKLWIRHGARLCTLVLLVLTAGAMISASGQMIALVWPHHQAYSLGAAGTLAAAYLLGFASLRPMSWLSAGLSGLFLCALGSAVPHSVGQKAAVIASGQGNLFRAAVCAAAYAGMNITLAIGVVCRCAQPDPKANRRTAWLFGGIMAVLMGASHWLYAAHPEWTGESFPIVRLLSCFGRNGFWMSAALVYLSVFTSLTAVLYALRCAAEQCGGVEWLRTAAVLGLPALVSCVGFAGIVDALYAPAGILCLLMVFAPLKMPRLTFSPD